MANFSDYYTKFKVFHSISTTNKALTTLVKFVQNLIIPLGLRIQHIRAHGDGKFIADYCKTTVIIPQFS